MGNTKYSVIEQIVFADVMDNKGEFYKEFDTPFECIRLDKLTGGDYDITINNGKTMKFKNAELPNNLTLEDFQVSSLKVKYSNFLSGQDLIIYLLR